MRRTFSLALLAAHFAALAPALAAVSPEEARQLGSSLTEFGAVRAGNANGSIPPYTGGLKTAPAGHKPGSGFWVDPFKGEKPLYRIDARNVAQYADKLSEGQRQLLARFPQYYLDVYPSHRTVAYPAAVLAATQRNATGCRSLKDGLAVDVACRGGMPFPIPKTGREVMWNHQLRYQGSAGMATSSSRSWVVDGNGRPIKTSEQQTYSDFPYYEQNLTDRDPSMAWRVYSITKSPARRVGEMTGLADYLDPTVRPRKAWTYTPVASMGGVIVYDELFVFSGMMDRFDFKLLGKKEMLIPYNSHKAAYDCPVPEVALLAHHANPACERWELHRVWVVDAVLRPGQRHAYSHRTYYFDEDLSGAGMFDAFDQDGSLARVMFNASAPMYDLSIPWAVKNVVYDFGRGLYAYLNDVMVGGFVQPETSRSERELNPEAVVARESTR
jgi:hypothetical protein